MIDLSFLFLAKTTDVYAMAVLAVLVIVFVCLFSYQEPQASETLVKEADVKPVESPPLVVEPTQPQFTGVQILGVLFMLGGFGLGLIACFMDVTVSSGSMTVNNIGLMNDRLMFLIAAGFAFLSGLMMMLLGGKK